MTSPLKSETARINGAQSNGPVTPEGKAVSSQNSLRHGLCSKQVVLPGEDQEAFERLRADCLSRFRPQGPAEHELVETIANTSWRLKRILRLETAMLSDETADPFKSLSLLIRYENQLNRTYDLAMKRLQELQENRVRSSARIQRNEPKHPEAISGRTCPAR